MGISKFRKIRFIVKKERVLILIPGKNARGGITNYYASIRKHLPDRIIYFNRGSRNWPQKKRVIIEVYRIISDYLYFIYYLLFKKISVVQTTTAFYKGSIIRDGIFILIARALKKKTIVFFRGWNDNYVYNLSGISLKFFKYAFLNSEAIIDLSNHNINYLKKLGFSNRLYLETTVVNEDLLKGVDIESLISQRLKSQKIKILFLSRIEKEKGIYKLLDVYQHLKSVDNQFELVFAGDGTELEALKTKVESDEFKDVHILGFVEGKEKVEIFKQANIFVFLSEFEGMPNAVLEAMAFGLPVVTTNVGGITSVFSNEKNGYLIDDYDINELSKYLQEIVKTEDSYCNIGFANHRKAQEHFMSPIVSKRILNIFEDVIKG